MPSTATKATLAVASPGKLPTRWWQWWPLLLGPLAISLVYGANAAELRNLLAKGPQEAVALGLSGGALLIGLSRACFGRHPFHIVISAVAITVFLRECHWEWTTIAVYVSLAGIAVWAFLWREQLTPYTDEYPKLRIWLISTAVVYVLSQVIARRVFRAILPHESDLHVPLEETAENMAHLMLIVVMLVDTVPVSMCKRGVNAAESCSLN